MICYIRVEVIIMRRAIIYYSLTDVTHNYCEIIKSKIGGDLIRLYPKKDLNPNSMSKFFWGGYSVLSKKTPELENFDFDIECYDEIFFATPVWAWSYAPALNSFFKNHDITDKNISLIATHEGGLGKTIQKMKKALPDNQFIGEIDLLNPNKDKDHIMVAKLNKWLEQFKKY